MGVGFAIASAIAEMLATGRWVQLARLRGDADPEALFCTVPGIGPETAHAIHDALHMDTLEALEAARSGEEIVPVDVDTDEGADIDGA